MFNFKIRLIIMEYLKPSFRIILIINILSVKIFFFIEKYKSNY